MLTLMISIIITRDRDGTNKNDNSSNTQLNHLASLAKWLSARL